MRRYESVCDCCMQAFPSDSPVLGRRDCPSCGVGMLLGPWPAAGRFEPEPRAAGVEPLAVAFRALEADEP